MEIVYVYTKKRSGFGRQTNFSDESPKLIMNIEPNSSLRANFIEKDPVDMAIQHASEMSEHEVRDEQIRWRLINIFIFR